MYLGDTGELVVQGPELDAAEREELGSPLLPEETAVRISGDVLARGLDAYRARAESAAMGRRGVSRSPGRTYATAAGHIVVRGTELDAVSLVGLEALLEHETAVRVEPWVVIEEVARIQARR